MDIKTVQTERNLEREAERERDRDREILEE